LIASYSGSSLNQNEKDLEKIPILKTSKSSVVATDSERVLVEAALVEIKIEKDDNGQDLPTWDKKPAPALLIYF
jgi:predicted aspartyl protease